MRLEKITERKRSAANRWYDDACGTAFALELIGERWSLLIMRELMFGPRRFGEIKAQLAGISANILALRLAGLEQAGILRRRKLPSPASVQVYELTQWGYESEPILQEMGRWATRSPRHDPRLPLSPASMMMSLRTMLDAERAKQVTATIGFRFDQDAFVARLAGGMLEIGRGDSMQPDVAFMGTPETLVGVFYGGRPIPDAEAAGQLRIEGDRALAQWFLTLFRLPAKLGGPTDPG